MDMVITFSGKSKVDAEYKGFTIKTDQSVFGGGDGSAPAPFDYFLASIGTCAGIYVMRFLQQRGYDPTKANIVLSTEKDRSRRMLSKIIIKVNLPEGFPEKYKKAIVNSVNLCAVKKHMHEPPQFETIVDINGKVVEVSVS